jgi:UDP-N-acetyl-D-mannosaminuronic acid dehydrogenase
MKKSKKRVEVNVIGLGYIGLPTASLMATKGLSVLGVDLKENVVKTINEGKVHIVEPDLDVLVKSAVQSEKLKAGLKPEAADTFIIAVPTPFKDNHQPDISCVEAAAESILPVLQEGNLVILESTSPVGTTELVASTIKQRRKDINKIYVAYCPERVLPGKILKELVENDRVIGGVDSVSTEKAREFYSRFVDGEILTTDARTAEMCKLSENAFRDVNIAFANELSLICNKLGIDVWKLIELANHHPRVKILNPGPGVGGHCIAVDPWFIVSSIPELARLIKTAREVNDSKPEWVLEKAREALMLNEKAVVGCLGLTFKADVDDMRESPALAITRNLHREFPERVLVCEPHIKTIKDLRLVDLETLLKKSDILLALVPHKLFKTIGYETIKKKILIDVCGLWRQSVTG